MEMQIQNRQFLFEKQQNWSLILSDLNTYYKSTVFNGIVLVLDVKISGIVERIQERRTDIK